MGFDLQLGYDPQALFKLISEIKQSPFGVWWPGYLYPSGKPFRSDTVGNGKRRPAKEVEWAGETAQKWPKREGFPTNFYIVEAVLRRYRRATGD
jgi:hypothetical protein